MMVPFRPQAGAPREKPAGAKSKSACWPAGPASHADPAGRPSAGAAPAGSGLGGYRRPQPRRGSKRCAKGSVRTPGGLAQRRWPWVVAPLRSALRGSCKGIVDFYHAAQQLWRARPPGWMGGRPRPAGGLAGHGTVSARHAGRGAGRPGGCLRRRGSAGASTETLRTVYAYLQRHREHINYDLYKDLSLPLGSGMVESACKWLIQQRFKGVGMRWSEDGFNHLLPLRLAGSTDALKPCSA